ncbi:type I restriction-modification system subunit M/S [Pseudomonas asiatica]|uniref:type I restriction-modification system subunit M/S n=1 Tax=Pseudomonas asiatica TaxID=2219225 RepID=UPI0018ABA25E|nr:type I restriction-modification system subunit M/S [Pseudomonas asiatica]MBF8805589.1 N-6 DNA methylase [Pseudomonas asiatica]
MHEKIFTQLMEVAQGQGLQPQDAMSVVLQLLCWRALSRTPGTLPDELSFESAGKQSAQGLRDLLPQLQQLKPQLFQDDRAWRQLREPRALLERIQQLESQGLMANLNLDDAAFWAADRPTDYPAMAPGLADFLLHLLQIQPGQHIYVPWENSGQIAARVARSSGAVWGEAMQPGCVAELLALTGAENWSLHLGDPVKTPLALEGGKLRTFDAAVCFSQMGLRYLPEVCDWDLFGRFPEKGVVGSVLQIRHLLAQTRGRIVIAVSNSVLFASGSERQLREHLLSLGYVQAVISLPKGLCTHAAIPVSVLILDNTQRAERVRFVDATADEFIEVKQRKRTDLIELDRLLQLVNGHEDCDTAVSATLDDIAANDFSLQVNRYVLSESARQLQASLARYPLRKLGDFFEVIRPRQHATASTGVAVSELQVSDLPQYGYITQASKGSLFDLDSQKSELYFLQRGDVLVTFKGAIGKVGIVGDCPEPGEGGWLAGQTQAVLRCRKPQLFPPESLVVYLHSGLGQSLLASQVVGASVATIKLSDLTKLLIPLPDPAELQRMAECFHQQNQIEQEIQQLRAKQAEIAAAFWAL